ncbi:hypothetical protein CERSUDRAFT_113397 [Gelatoporia subvermispora B]|uniref:F-box domain-containing protein n=1 Tax=Ceriporiopsis subvermispora (strain B) TaxID=914234 RepID=M2QMG5_CERS8|nr:hypothetical protein CERSUDRAFT_113397 [Gelatoporia subvermispora B]
MTVALPPEIVDEAIDHLWDDPVTLKACSLACRSWVPSSRLHLFRTVRLRNGTECARFGDLVASTPAIPRCVRQFTLSAEYRRVNGQAQPVEDDGWIDAAAELVPKLERVTTLGLSRVRWGALKPETRTAFQGLFKGIKTLFLFEVRFDTAKDVLSFLSAFPVLTSLYFHGVSWPDDMLGHATLDDLKKLNYESEHGRMQLSYLFLDPRSSPTLVTEWLLNHPTEQHLRTIQLCWRELESMKSVGDLLHASGASLESLQVEFPAGVPEAVVLEDQLSLTQNTGLRSLQFGGLTVHSESARTFLAQRLFPWVLGMLSQVRSTRLQEITFELDIGAVCDLHRLDWARMDATLCRSEFSGIEVTFYVICAETSGNTDKDIKNLIREGLPGFSEKGTLRVSCI